MVAAKVFNGNITNYTLGKNGLKRHPKKEAGRRLYSAILALAYDGVTNSGAVKRALDRLEIPYHDQSHICNVQKELGIAK